jgi:excisionase family DNA binding protein
METDEERMMTVRDLAVYLRVHPTTVYRQLKRGQLPAFKVGSDWRFDRELIDRWAHSSIWLDQHGPFMSAGGEKKLKLASAAGKGAGALFGTFEK